MTSKVIVILSNSIVTILKLLGSCMMTSSIAVIQFFPVPSVACVGGVGISRWISLIRVDGIGLGIHWRQTGVIQIVLAPDCRSLQLRHAVAKLWSL